MIFFVLSQRAHALQAHRGVNREEKMWACLDRLCATYDLLRQTHTNSQKEETRLNWHGHSLALAHFFAIFLTGACACMYVSVCVSPELESLFFWHIFSSSLVSCSIHLANDCYYVWLTESTAKTLGRQKRDTNSSNNNVEQKFPNVWRLNLYLCEVKKKSQ